MSDTYSDELGECPEAILTSLSVGDEARVTLKRRELVGTIDGDIETYEKDSEADDRVVIRNMRWSDDTVEAVGMMRPSGTLQAWNRGKVLAGYDTGTGTSQGIGVRRGVLAKVVELEVVSDE